jgi:hypothetical protein
VAVTVIGVFEECRQVAKPKLSVCGFPVIVLPMLALVVSESDHITFVRFDCVYEQLPAEACPPNARNCCELPGDERL